MNIERCVQCDLSISRNSIVSGEGNKTGIMLIGEAPGYHEDKYGRPFVGKSGQLLNKYLECAGLKREDVYITNIVKCRPPNNRNPYIKEMNICQKHLALELQELSPKLIVCLGAIAASRIIPNFKTISNQRKKKFYIYENRIVMMATYHPAYILVNSLYSLYLKDWKLIEKVYKLLINPFHTNNFERSREILWLE